MIRTSACVMAIWLGTPCLAAAVDVKRVDIMVDGTRPLAGERSRFALGPDGQVAFAYVLAAGKTDQMCAPYGTIGVDGRVRLGAVESETTWNVEGWGG
jgi:hypothetical protein